MRKASNPEFTLNNYLEIGKELSKLNIRPISCSQVTGIFTFSNKLPNWLCSFIAERKGIVRYL
jgi:hypothetical protein